MSNDNLIVKANELAAIQRHNAFVLDFAQAMQDEGTPVAVLSAVVEYLLQYPGRAWWGCSVDGGGVILAISASDDDYNDDWVSVIVINHRVNRITVNEVTTVANASAILNAMNNVEYEVVVPDIEITTAAAKQAIAESKSEILAVIVAETTAVVPTGSIN
jgi:hypothetical protein